MYDEELARIKKLEELHKLWKKALMEENEYEAVSDGKNYVAINSYYEDGIVDEGNYLNGEKALFIMNEPSINEKVDNIHRHKDLLANINQVGNEFTVGNPEGNTVASFRIFAGIQDDLEKKEKPWANKARFKFGEMYRIWTNNISKKEVKEWGDPDNQEAVKHIAFMNLNKRGGFGNVKDVLFEKYLNKYYMFIRKEINLISPSIIIWCACNTCKDEYLRLLFDDYKIGEYVVLDNGNKIPLVKMWHPSYTNRIRKKAKEFPRHIYLESSTSKYLERFRILTENVLRH